MAARLPLADVKVLDFFWVLAGPGVTRSMADYGATVVRIESTQRVDPTRTVGPSRTTTPTPSSPRLRQQQRRQAESLARSLQTGGA